MVLRTLVMLVSLVQSPIKICQSSLKGAMVRASPLTIEDAVTDPAMAVDVGVQHRSNESCLRWIARIVLRHVKVQ